jgi:hypothetical protein
MIQASSNATEAAEGQSKQVNHPSNRDKTSDFSKVKQAEATKTRNSSWHLLCSRFSNAAE